MSVSVFRKLRNLFGCFATGITVVTMRTPQGDVAGITINSFTSVSLDPPLVLFCLAKTARLAPLLRKSRHFAVNILGAEQEAVSRHFASKEQNPLPATAFGKDVLGCPVLKGSLGWMVCKVKRIDPGGDHWIIVGEIKAMQQARGQQKPLLYFRSGYERL